jgi:uncharacterized membrane protein YfcA
LSSPLQEFGLPSDVLLWQAALLVIVSVAAGMLGGFVGLALGSIRLPALLLLGVSAPTAAGTNIVVSAASALVGAVSHLRGGRVDARVALMVGVPSVAGAFLGAFTSAQAPESLLVLIVGVLVVWQGVEFIAQARSEPDPPPGEVSAPGVARHRPLTPNRIWAGVVAGLATGLLGGAIGLIMGSLRLPALIRILRMDPRMAVGTNLFIGFIMGSMGWVGHMLQGQVDYPLAVTMGAGAMVGSYFGARLTGRVGLRRLILTIGVVLTGSGLLLVYRAVAL